MIGYRGCYRYVNEPDLFALELELLARVRDQTPNLHLMLPFVRTRWELEACLEAIDASPLGRHRGLRRWVMAEVPSIIYWLPEYAAMGIDGVSIGSNDLTQLMLGVDRDSEIVRGAVRRVRCGRSRRDREDHRSVPSRWHHVLALRPGADEQARIRGAPRALRDRLHLRRPHRRREGAHGDRCSREAPAARIGPAAVSNHTTSSTPFEPVVTFASSADDAVQGR